MKKSLTFLIILSVLASFVFAQENSIVDLKILSSTNKMVPGNSHRIALRVHIKKPYHINSNRPSEDYLIPTTVDFKQAEGIAFGKIDFPKSEMKQFAFSESPLAVYQDSIYIFSTISILPGFHGKEITIEGTFGYQACDDNTCQAPAEVVFHQVFPVADSSETVQSVNTSIFSGSEPGAPPAEMVEDGEAGFASTVEQSGLLLTFLLVFVGGLALNLTPCVYPLIPITISYFGGQSDGSRGSVVIHAVLYVLGMAVTYSVLGMIAAFTGGLFGAALQNPVVLVVIALILVGLSLSMFDLYEIRVPAFLSNFAGGSKQGYFGTVFMGLTVGIVAAPCIGPFVLALLTYVGNEGNVLLGFSLFFVLALGLGVPFLFLGIFSGSINKLPRSGAWMVWVRSIFGFILIAMAVYFLAPLFPNTLLYYLTLAMIMLVGGIYMAWLEPTKSAGKVFPVIRNVIGILFFAVALYAASNGIREYIDDKIAEVGTATGSQMKAENEIQWFDYSEDKITEAVSLGKPVMLDFYADWCIPCKELEKFTFSKPEVVDLSKNFTMLKVDLTSNSSPTVKRLKEQYDIRGVPTLVFLSAGGQELKKLRIIGFVEVEDFLPIMKNALNQIATSNANFN